MKNLSDKYLMMVEPDTEGKPSSEPTDDNLTRKMAILFILSHESSKRYRGFHMTKCGKCSDNTDWVLPNGMITHSLCVYYIRFYRAYISDSEINKINMLFEEVTKGISQDDLNDLNIIPISRLIDRGGRSKMRNLLRLMLDPAPNISNDTYDGDMILTDGKIIIK